MRAPALALAALAIVATTACSRRSPTTEEPAKRTAPVSVAAPAAAEPGSGTLDPNDPRHGTRKLKNLDAPVFVDGVQVAVLRYGDLPSIPREMLEGGTPSFRLYDYLKGIGVAPEAVRSVHLHGNNDRIGSVEGRELTGQKSRFTFTFSSQTTGTPTQKWDTGGLANEFVVHEIRKMSVFVKKAPAGIHPQLRCHLDASGACTKDVPYAEGDAAKGTRVVLDGRMVGFVKRRRIGDDLALGKTESGDTTFGVAKLARSFGVPADGLEAVELVAGDDVVARATPEQWARVADALAFTLPRHQHGKVRVAIPAEIQAPGATKTADALVSAIVVYRKTVPVDRELAVANEDTDLAVQLASNDEGPGDREGREGKKNEATP